MAVSIDTTKKIVDMLQGHISLDKAEEIFSDLGRIHGNSGFRISMKMISDEIKKRQK